MDPPKPIGAHGAYEHVEKRFKNEFVLASALIHHLYWSKNPIDKIIEKITTYATKYALIEYIPSDDKFVKDTSWEQKWFSLEQITNKLKELGWKNIEILNSTPHPRKWVFAIK